MKQYFYDGPIMVFDKCVASEWKAATTAVSEKQARNNLTYQAKQYLGKVTSARVTLPGKITVRG